GGNRSRRLSVPSAPLVPDQSCATDQREPGESRRHCDVGARRRELLAVVVSRAVAIGRAAAIGGAVLTGGSAVVGELGFHFRRGHARLAVGDAMREQRGHQHRERGGLRLLLGVLGRRGRNVVGRRIRVLRGGGIGLVRGRVRLLAGRRGGSVLVLVRCGAGGGLGRGGGAVLVVVGRAVAFIRAVPARVAGVRAGAIAAVGSCVRAGAIAAVAAGVATAAVAGAAVVGAAVRTVVPLVAGVVAPADASVRAVVVAVAGATVDGDDDSSDGS